MMMLCKPAKSRMIALTFLMGFYLLFSSAQADAQSLRDPTLPPAETGLASTAPSTKLLGIEPGAISVIVRNGHPYLAVNTRLYASGQKLGVARIERISETEVWLRVGRVLHKVPRFPGIQRRAVTPLDCGSGDGQLPDSATSCARVKP